MKTAEMLYAIGKDTSRKFKKVGWEEGSEINIDDIRCAVGDYEIYEDTDWEEVKQHVPWQEAIQAYKYYGKNIMCEFGGKKSEFNRLYETHTSHAEKLTLDMIINGKWYIL